MFTIKGMSPAGLLRRTKNGLNKRLSRIVKPLFLNVKSVPYSVTKLGQGDGSWYVLVDALPQQAVCYCVGVGLDASFDVALAELGYEVHSFDPTPLAKQYAVSENLSKRGVSFHPIGVWSENTKMKFFASSNERSANFSTQDIHGTGKYVETDCYTLKTIMKDLGHSKIDLLKLDIEGSWEPLLVSMINDQITPTQLCVEMDSPTSLFKIYKMVSLLEVQGYEVLRYDNEDFLFVNKNHLEVH